MARCFCGDTGTCNCTIQAGDGITVTGTGAGDDPYIVTADPQVGNIVEADTATVDMSVTGSGTGGDPWVIAADVVDEGIQDIIGAALGNGLTYDDGANTISALISADANNAVIFGGDNGLYVTDVTATTISPLTDYVNGYSAYASTGFYEPRGIMEISADHIRMRGRVIVTPPTVTGDNIAKLPVGMEPQRTVQFSVTGNSGTMLFLEIQNSGQIIMRTNAASDTAFSLDGVTFYIGAN